MLAYVTLGTNDLDRAGTFYDAVLAPLGIVRRSASEGEIGYGPDPAPSRGRQAFFYLLTPFNNLPATWGNGVDVAFDAPTRAAIDAFHAAGLAQGGLDEGAPGLRSHYHAQFYTAYLRDPDGNKINAVYEGPA
jgi:catechol 2,3-dioxygenase-like lactoylglutathione lyase family enzyme